MTSANVPKDPGAIRDEVRRGYARYAEAGAGCDCECARPAQKAADRSRCVGYTDEQLAALPEGANLGAGCGNPTAFAEIRPGETVLDLGSGAGIDCFLAAAAVGAQGRVIGVDMTDEMIEKARKNAAAGGYANVEFRKGLIEDLPVDDGSVDLLISNCVINLSPQKDRVFAEAFRVLKPGGRLLVSDIVLERELPPELVDDLPAYIGCIAGAVLRDEYLRLLRDAGFAEIEILSETGFGGPVDRDTPAWEDAASQMGIEPAAAAEWASSALSLQLRAVKGRIMP